MKLCYIVLYRCTPLQMVMDVSKKYLPSMAVGFDSPKLTVFVGDGFEYLKQHKDYFDVIITDSSDPESKLRLPHNICCNCLNVNHFYY